MPLTNTVKCDIIHYIITLTNKCEYKLIGGFFMKTAFKITNIVMLAVTLIYFLASTVIGFLTGDILSLLFALLPILLTILMNISGIKGNYKSSVTVSIVLFFIYLLTLIFANDFIMAIIRLGIIIAYLCFANYMKKNSEYLA